LAIELIVEHAQVAYTAPFVSPAFELWGDTRKITQGIYETFSSFGVKLANIKGESGATAADQVVTVNIGKDVICRFRFEGVEVTAFRYSREFSQYMSAMLAALEKWVRGAAPSVRFASHQFAYSAHCALREGDGESFLRKIGLKAPESGGTDRGIGLIFHWDLPENASSQLVVDKSVLMSNGLYIALTLLVGKDVIDFAATGQWVYHYLENVLRDLGLMWKADSETFPWSSTTT
jgi:hypothetical protein